MLIAAVLVSSPDLDCEEGLGKPLMASLSSRNEASEDRKEKSEESFCHKAVSLRQSKANRHDLFYGQSGRSSLMLDRY